MDHLENSPDKIVSVPAPVVKQSQEFSLVWMIPVITLLIGGWLIFKTLSEQGPTVTISFKTAEGLIAGKTRVKYKNVQIGTVESLNFSEDFTHVLVQVRFDPGADPLLKRGTQFWVVKPRIDLRGASGLDTLVSGAYIELDPGQGVAMRQFEGLEQPPVVISGQPGKKIALIAEELGSIDRGSPIYYQGILVGEVTGYELANDHRSVYVHAFINAPYDDLVKANTRFWNVSGLDLSLGVNGLSVRTESMQSLVYGGIAFDTLGNTEQSPFPANRLIYTLHKDLASIQAESFTRKIQFVMYFDGSVRGLSVGAPVEFKGIKIGSVIDVRLEFNFDGHDYLIPVVVEIEPERIIPIGNKAKQASATTLLQRLIAQGMRAQLASGNLLTGQLYVALNMHPDTPIKLVKADSDLPELPTIPGNLAAFTASFQSILSKLDELDLEQISEEFIVLLKSTNEVVQSPDIKRSLSELNQTLQVLKGVLSKIDESRLDVAINSAEDAFNKTQITLDLLNNLLRSDSPVQSSVVRLASELEETARSIRILMEMLERNPESILSGKQIRGD